MRYHIRDLNQGKQLWQDITIHDTLILVTDVTITIEDSIASYTALKELCDRLEAWPVMHAADKELIISFKPDKMYFTLDKNSAAGKRLLDIERRAAEARSMIERIVKKHKATSWVKLPGVAYGGVNALCFNKPPNPNIYKKLAHGYYPKRTTREAQMLAAEIEALPTIEKQEA